MISSVCKHSLIAHTAQLLGQGAAIEIEVVCELLAVEGNIELIPALPCSLAGKISQQPAAHIFWPMYRKYGSTASDFSAR